MALLDVYGEPVKDLESCLVVSSKVARVFQKRRENKQCGCFDCNDAVLSGGDPETCLFRSRKPEPIKYF